MGECNLEEKKKTGLRLAFLIVDMHTAKKAEALLKKAGLHTQYRFSGEGTATNQTLDLLGLEETDKKILICVVPKKVAKLLLQKLADYLYLREAGCGIAFTVPIDGVSAPVMRLIDGQTHEKINHKTQKEVKKMGELNYNLILAMINRGFSDDIMETARSVGAMGGTVIHARQLGLEDTMKFWGISVQEEKEIVMIITKKEHKTAIMRAIGEKHGVHSDAHGMILSLPVDHFIGADLDGDITDMNMNVDDEDDNE